MRGYDTGITDKDLKNVVDSTLKGLLLASFVRYFALGGAVFKFVTGPALENVVPGLILFTISFLMHYAVYPYMGFRPFSYRRLNRPEDFNPLRDWMVPGYDIEELCGNEYHAIMNATTKEEHLALKLIREKNGMATVGDFTNLMLLRLQCEKSCTSKGAG